MKTSKIKFLTALLTIAFATSSLVLTACDDGSGAVPFMEVYIARR